MATEKQTDFFRYLFEEENSREKQLDEYAKHLLSLVTLYSGFVIFVAEKKHLETFAPRLLFALAIAAMLLGFLATIYGSRMADYEGITDPEDVIDDFGDVALTDEEFFDLRIADFSVATNRNSLVNDKKAEMLLFASYCLAAGIFFHAAFFLMSI